VPGKRGYVFDTGSLSGVEADREYQVVLRLMDMQNGEELERQEKRSNPALLRKPCPTVH
jgi:hypothetical protein